jgi:hypothetical protein
MLPLTCKSSIYGVLQHLGIFYGTFCSISFTTNTSIRTPITLSTFLFCVLYLNIAFHNRAWVNQLTMHWLLKEKMHYGLICGLLNDAVRITHYTMLNEAINEYWIRNNSTKWSWPNLKHCPGICLEGLRNTTEVLILGSQPWDQDTNYILPKYEVIPLRLVHYEIIGTHTRAHTHTHTHTHTHFG